MRIERREKQRRSAQVSVLAGSNRFRSNILQLSRHTIETGTLAAVNYVGMQRIGCNVAPLIGANGMRFPERDFSVISPTRDSNRTALLLASNYIVWKLIVRDDVIELGCGLIIP